MKRWMAAAVMAVGSCSMVHAGNPMPVGMPVDFDDSELKAAVEAELNVTNPTTMDMEGLTRLHVLGTNISSLKGLQCATNLTELGISCSQVSDLSWLAGLTKLRSLVLWDNRVEDLSPLAGLTNLERLDLDDNQVRNLSPLTGLTSLTHLYLSFNQIDDISPLAKLTNLEYLALEDNRISDVSPLAGLHRLIWLNLNCNQVSDISWLPGLIEHHLEVVTLLFNPLNQDAYDTYIPDLLAAGIIVCYDPLVMVAVPNVVGMSEVAAEQTLLAQGLWVWITTAASQTVPAGHVVSQNPVAGTQVMVLSCVTLTISTGPGGGPEPEPTPGPGLPTPVAHWKLDEASGIVAADSAGSHNGQLHGGPTWLPQGGIIDGALRFDGTNDYVDCGTFNPSAATGKLTVCLWAKWNGLTDWFQVLIAKRDAWQAGQMMWQLESSINTGTVGFFREGSGSSDGFVLPIGEWTHVAATCDGTTARLYYDGQQVTSGPMAFGSDTTARVVFGACHSNGENPFNGTLDDVRLYDQVLSTDQILTVMGGAGTIPWIRAAYWDTRYPTSWVQGSSVRDVLASAGYAVLNADQLKTWMNARTVDGQPSVVVFCQDVAPDTVYETASATCTLRRYLNAGGKVVWYGDIPLYYQGHSDGTRTAFDTGGSVGVLGFNAAGGVWGSGEQVILTSDGYAWGLTQTWPSGRPAQAAGLRVLATDSTGQATGWVKHFVPGDTYRGFVRLSDCSAAPNAKDIRRLAEYPNTPAPINSEGLVAHWKLDGDATDSVGTSHGTVHGNPVWAIGKIDGALHLDGVGDYVDCGTNAALSLTEYITVAAWVNMAAVQPDWKSIIAKGDSAWRLSTLPGQKKFHFGVGGPPDYPDVDGVRDVGVSQWHHVAGTYDGSTIRLYVDGVLDATLPYTGGIDANTQPVFIGENSERTGRTWQGLIDDVRIYNRALTEGEIKDLVTL